MIKGESNNCSRKLAEYVINTKYEMLPKKALNVAKRNILDTIGTLVAGADAPGCQAIVNLVSEWAGKGESTLLVYGGKVPAHNAAMVNSTMARALDFDNAMPRGLHSSACAFPTALAVAEMRGKVNGREFLTAVAMGEDLAARIHLASTYSPGSDPTGICMVFGTAAIAAKILRLDADKTLNALGIALSLCSGSLQMVLDGSLFVRVSQGIASRSGILAAMLAEKGINGAKNIFEGPRGYSCLFSQQQFNTEVMIEQLGKRFESDRFFFKRYPGCGHIQASTQATLELIREYNFQPDDIEEIVVHLSKASYELVGKPFEIKDNPQVDAQFSVIYAVANAVLRRDSLPEHFTEEFITHPQIIKIVQKVHPAFDEEVEKKGQRLASIVEIAAKDGRKCSNFVKWPKGFPQNPLDQTELEEKYKNCMSCGPKWLTQDTTEEILKLVNNLEEIEDISHVAQLLTAAGSNKMRPYFGAASRNQ